MAKLHQIQTYKYTIPQTADDPEPCVVLFRRMTVAEYLADMEARAELEGEQIKIGAEAMTDLAGGDAGAARKAAFDAGLRVVKNEKTALEAVRALLTKHTIEVTGLEGWQDECHESALDARLSSTPIAPGMAKALRDAPSVGEALGE